MSSEGRRAALVIDGLALCAQQEGHADNWILPLGSAPGPIKGARSHYYNEWQWDSDPSTGGDFASGKNVPVSDIYGENFVDNEQVSWSVPGRIQRRIHLYARLVECAAHALEAFCLSFKKECMFSFVFRSSARLTHFTCLGSPILTTPPLSPTPLPPRSANLTAVLVMLVREVNRPLRTSSTSTTGSWIATAFTETSAPNVRVEGERVPRPTQEETKRTRSRVFLHGAAWDLSWRVRVSLRTALGLCVHSVFPPPPTDPLRTACNVFFEINSDRQTFPPLSASSSRFCYSGCWCTQVYQRRMRRPVTRTPRRTSPRRIESRTNRKMNK